MDMKKIGILLAVPLKLWAVDAGAALQVTDDSGALVRLDRPAARIVSLAPHLTETLFAVGGGRQVVGTAAHSDHPKAARAIPRVGTHKSVNEEAVLALRPDLVVAWQTGNGLELVRRLRGLGLTVYVSEPRKLEDIAQTLRRMGLLTGRPMHGERAGRAFMEELNRLRGTYRGRPEVTVFYQVWNSPLQTLNGRHLVSDVIRLCGGRNVFADAVALAPLVNLESLLAMNPGAIIASGVGDERPDWLDDWRDWPALDAVKNNHLYFIPADLLQRHSPRILAGAGMMCEQLQKARQAP